MDMLPEDADEIATSPIMQSSFQGFAIEEEEFIDNIERPDLIISTSSEALSSLFASDSGLDHPEDRQDDWELKNVDNSEGKSALSSDSPPSKLFESAVEHTQRQTNSSTPKSKLSLSMHDVSEIPIYPLMGKSSHDSSSTIQSQSITTDTSVPKSKDSGFARSVSCFSLNSSRRYDHVQSKVKKYINQIKQESNNSRVVKSSYNPSVDSKNMSANLEDSNNESLSVGMLIPVIDKLKEQLEDKDKMLLKLQENYDNLLMEYAAAKNRIDYLRISSASIQSGSPMPFSFDVTNFRKPKASTSILLLPELDKLLNEPSDFGNSFKPTKHIQLKLPKQDHTKSLSQDSEPLDRSASDQKDIRCAMNLEVGKHNMTRDNEKELSPERLNRQRADNPFVKVMRWQDSLPSFELIEPSSYDSLPSNSNSTNQGKSDSASSKLSNLHSTKDDSSSNNTSNLLRFSRSISQPNYIVSSEDLGLSMDINQANSLLSLSSAQFSSGSLKYEIDSITRGSIFDINASTATTLHLHPNKIRSSNNGTKHNQPSYSSSHHRYVRIPDVLQLCRKKVVNWKAKNILFEHIKGSTDHKTHSLVLPQVKCVLNFQKSALDRKNMTISNPTKLSGNVEEMNLVQCLDEVNQCAKNLNGKSEAIMQTLAKQLHVTKSSAKYVYL